MKELAVSSESAAPARSRRMNSLKFPKQSKLKRKTPNAQTRTNRLYEIRTKSPVPCVYDDTIPHVGRGCAPFRPEQYRAGGRTGCASFGSVETEPGRPRQAGCTYRALS